MYKCHIQLPEDEETQSEFLQKLNFGSDIIENFDVTQALCDEVDEIFAD